MQKGTSIDVRMYSDIFDSQCFDRIRAWVTDFDAYVKEKVVPIAGDIVSPRAPHVALDQGRPGSVGPRPRAAYKGNARDYQLRRIGRLHGAARPGDQREHQGAVAHGGAGARVPAPRNLLAHLDGLRELRPAVRASRDRAGAALSKRRSTRWTSTWRR